MATGTLHDPHTGTVVPFTRGVATSTAVQIDHMVALADAWQTGAQQLSAASRQNLANDPLNLQATDGPVNEQKGDGDAATWLPPDKAYRCTYVTRQIQVKAKYQLWATPAEHDAIAANLNACTGPAPSPGPVPPPAAGGSTGTTAARAATPTSSKTAAVPPPPSSAAAAGVYYANCAAVRAAGNAPLHRGDPEYRAGLDRDDDGIACE